MAPTLLFNSIGYTETEISQVTTPKTNSKIHHTEIEKKEISSQSRSIDISKMDVQKLIINNG